MACVGLLCDLVGNCSFGCIILCCIHDPEGFWLYFERCCRRNVNPFDISKLQPPQNCNSVSAEGVDAGKQEQHSEQTHPGQGKTVKFRKNSVILKFFFLFEEHTGGSSTPSPSLSSSVHEFLKKSFIFPKVFIFPLGWDIGKAKLPEAVESI